MCWSRSTCLGSPPPRDQIFSFGQGAQRHTYQGEPGPLVLGQESPTEHHSLFEGLCGSPPTPSAPQLSPGLQAVVSGVYEESGPRAPLCIGKNRELVVRGKLPPSRWGPHLPPWWPPAFKGGLGSLRFCPQNPQEATRAWGPGLPAPCLAAFLPTPLP